MSANGCLNPYDYYLAQFSLFYDVLLILLGVWLSDLKPPVVLIVLDHIHEVASKCFQEVGRVHLWLDLQFGTQAEGEEGGRQRKKGNREEEEERMRRGNWGMMDVEKGRECGRDRKENRRRVRPEHVLSIVQYILGNFLFSCALRKKPQAISLSPANV